jgi:alpha-L-rhamnosidase
MMGRLMLVTAKRMQSCLAPLLIIAFCSLAATLGTAFAFDSSQAQASIVHLTTNGLEEPLGTALEAPQFSWQIADSRTGARQSAYEILVASSAARLEAGNADVWDSGKVSSDQSVNVSYAGPALKGQARYFWRVRVWGTDGAAYPESKIEWWETGLADASEWKAQWIAAETEEHKLIRESGAEWIWSSPEKSGTNPAPGLYGFRAAVELPEKPKSAKLFVTAKDSPSAWINGSQVLQTQPMTPWGNMPWGTYQQIDITSHLHAGRNVFAIGATLYGAQRAGMSAVLLWQTNDGTYHLLRSGDAAWKASATPQPGWTEASFNDQSWDKAVTIAKAGTGDFGRPWPADSVNLLRQTFTVTKPIRSARLYATALGAYRFRVDGQRVGDQILSPGWTDYRERVFYQTYDLTNMLRAGSNTIGATLAPGWYSTPLMWLRQPYNYGNTPPALRAQLRIEFSDGTVRWINTDGNWRSHPSPVLKAEIYDGEDYDARREIDGWDTPGSSQAGWKPVDVVQPIEPRIIPQSFEPIREDQALRAVKITTPSPGVTVYDFGQNLAGVARIKVQGPAGTEVRLRFAEVLNPDGTIYTENLRSAKATDHYILKGSGIETFEPEFTFHGFRYVEVTGVPKGDVASVEAVAFHTAAPFDVQLVTGSPMINKLWSNIEWGQRSNFVGVPTDCPQRDERLGWTADAQVFWRTASFNMNLEPFTRKYTGDLRGTALNDGMFGIYAPGTNSSSNAISPGWSDAGVIIPWTGWLQYADDRVAQENWDAMARYLDVIETANPDHLWRNKSGIGFGDWLAPGNKTSNMLAATAYWAYDAQLMVQMAHALNKTADEEKYQAMFQAVREAFEHRYVRPDGTITAGTIIFPSGAQGVEHATGIEGDDEKDGPGTQTGYALALFMHLVPDQLRTAAAAKLVDLIHSNGDLLGTGFLGTPYILAVLADTGHSDLAYKLLLNTRYPSWGYQVEHGATTMWERWNGDKMMNDPGMNSFNHYAYGAVAAWIYQYAAGVDASSEDPGYRRIYLHPNFSRALGKLDFTYQTPYGSVRSAWTAPASGPVTWTVTIPANSSGFLDLTSADAQRYSMDGHPLSGASSAYSGTKSFEVPSGTHVFSVSL